MSDPVRVFVSHSHTDNDFALEIVESLRAAGEDVWYDEQQLQHGELGPVIERELEARTVLVVVLSPAALQSEWVQREVRMFEVLSRRDRKRILLPVVAKPIQDESSIWLFLQDYKRIQKPGVGCSPLASDQAIAHVLSALTLNYVSKIDRSSPQNAAVPATDRRSEAFQCMCCFLILKPGDALFRCQNVFCAGTANDLIYSKFRHQAPHYMGTVVEPPIDGSTYPSCT